MDNYLTTLYFKKFQNTQEQKRLNENKDFDSEGNAHRNDEKIAGCQRTNSLLNDLITKYMEFREI